jgi:hypothetical protein
MSGFERRDEPPLSPLLEKPVALPTDRQFPAARPSPENQS